MASNWREEQPLTQELQEFQVNAYFVSKFYFGSQRQPIYLAVDTGSSWTWTMTDDCKVDCADYRSYEETFEKRGVPGFVPGGDDALNFHR